MDPAHLPQRLGADLKSKRKHKVAKTQTKRDAE